MMRPSSRLRAVAAWTASISAARTARSSSTRTPAAVVPPGDVTIARSPAGSPRSASSAAEPTSNCATISSATCTRQPGDHAGVHQCLRDEEHVRRARTGQTGDRVELRLRDASTTSRRRAGRSRPSRDRRRSYPRAPDSADTPSPTSAGVFGIVRMTVTSAPTAARIVSVVTPAATDRRRARPGGDGGRGDRRHVRRLHREDRRSSRPGCRR